MVNKAVVNYTNNGEHIRVKIPVGISYDSSLQKACSLLKEIAGEVEGTLDDPPVEVWFTNFGESSIDLELLVWIEDARQMRRISSNIRKRIKERFDEDGIHIPFPHRTVIMADRSSASR